MESESFFTQDAGAASRVVRPVESQAAIIQREKAAAARAKEAQKLAEQKQKEAERKQKDAEKALAAQKLKEKQQQELNKKKKATSTHKSTHTGTHIRTHTGTHVGTHTGTHISTDTSMPEADPNSSLRMMLATFGTALTGLLSNTTIVKRKVNDLSGQMHGMVDNMIADARKLPETIINKINTTIDRDFQKVLMEEINKPLPKEEVGSYVWNTPRSAPAPTVSVTATNTGTATAINTKTTTFTS